MSESVAFAQNQGILQTGMDQSEDYMKVNFKYFQITKSMLQTVRAQKEDEKMGHLSNVHVSFLSYDP